MGGQHGPLGRDAEAQRAESVGGVYGEGQPVPSPPARGSEGVLSPGHQAVLPIFKCTR